MKRIAESPKKAFLFLGLGLIVVSALMFYFSMIFLFFFYLIPGLILIYFYFIYYLFLNSDGMVNRNFWGVKKRIDWSEIKIVRSTTLNSLIIEAEKTKVKIPDVFNDRKQITDFIIRHVEKSKVSNELLGEWSKYYFLYQKYE